MSRKAKIGQLVWCQTIWMTQPILGVVTGYGIYTHIYVEIPGDSAHMQRVFFEEQITLASMEEVTAYFLEN